MRSIRAQQWFIRKENWLQQCKSLFTFLPLCLLVRRYLRLKKHSWLSKKFSEKTKSTRWGVRITALRSTIVRRKNKKLCCGVQMQSKSQVSMHVLKINRGLQSARRNKLHQFQSVVSRDMTPQAKARQRKSSFIWVITSQGCPSLSTYATPINKGPQRCVRKLTHFDTAWGGGHCCRSSNKQRWLHALYPRR